MAGFGWRPWTSRGYTCRRIRPAGAVVADRRCPAADVRWRVNVAGDNASLDVVRAISERVDDIASPSCSPARFSCVQIPGEVAGLVGLGRVCG